MGTPCVLITGVTVLRVGWTLFTCFSCKASLDKHNFTCINYIIIPFEPWDQYEKKYPLVHYQSIYSH